MRYWRSEEQTVLMSARWSTSRFIIAARLQLFCPQFKLQQSTVEMGGAVGVRRIQWWEGSVSLILLQAVMSRTGKPELAIYKSQAQQRSTHTQPSLKLYGSGASAATNRNTLKPAEQQSNPSRRLVQSKSSSQFERAIDNLSMQSKMIITSRNGGDSLLRNKSNEHVQSPRKGTSDGFKSILEEINEQNDRTIEQLDDDLKRIKSNLTKIQQESFQAKESTQNQILSEEIELLQQQNERLREKNLELLNEKKSLAHEVEQYETLIQRERVKQLANQMLKQGSEWRNDEAAIRKIKTALEEKDEQCSKLKQEIARINSAKSMVEKRQTIILDEKNKLNFKIIELQKQKNALKLSIEDSMKAHVQKKQAHFSKLLQTTERKYEETTAKLKIAQKQQTNAKLQEIASSKDAQIQKLQSQIKVLKSVEQNFKTISDSRFYQERIESVNSEIEFLTFSYKQATQQLRDREQQLSIIRQKFQKMTEQILQLKNQADSVNIRLQEEKKRSQMLQELYSRLEKQSQGLQEKYQSNLSSYKEAILQYQSETNRTQLEFHALREQKSRTQQKMNDVLLENQRLISQNRKKCDQILQLKKQNFHLAGEQKAMRREMFYSPQKYVRVDRIERVISADPKQALHNKEKEKEHVSKIKAMEKQLNDLVSECRAETDKQRLAFKEKQHRIQNDFNFQKKRVHELEEKNEQMQKEIQRLTISYLRKEEGLVETVRKRETEARTNQMKAAENSIKISLLQNQNKDLKERIEQKREKPAIVQIKETYNKPDNSKEESQQLIKVLLRELKIIIDNGQQQKFGKLDDLTFLMKDTKSLSNLHLIAELNYLTSSLKDLIRNLIKKSKKKPVAQNYPQIYYKNHFGDSQLNLIKRAAKQERNEEKKDFYHGIILKNNELESKCQRLQNTISNATKEMEDLQEQLKASKRENSKLHEEVDQIEQERSKLQRKMQKMQQKINLIKQQEQKQRENAHSQLYMLHSPVKDLQLTGMFSQTDIQQLRDGRIRNRIRSARSCQRNNNILDRREPDSTVNRENDMRIIQMQMNYSKMKKEAEMREGEFQAMRKENSNLKGKFKAVEDKLLQKNKEQERLEEELAEISQEKESLIHQVSQLEKEMKVLVEELLKVNRRGDQQGRMFNNRRQLFQKTIKDLSIERQSLQKKYKRESAEKDAKMVGIVQKCELKSIELNSQITRHKQKLRQCELKIQVLISKLQKFHNQYKKQQQKLKESANTLGDLRQKVEQQQREKEKMLQVFSSNTGKLTKMLQEKEIEIEELKFIQESTLINLEQVRSRKKNDNSYSFRYES